MDWFATIIESSDRALAADVLTVLGDSHAQYMRGHFGDLLADIVRAAAETGSPLGTEPGDDAIVRGFLQEDIGLLPLDGDGDLGEAFWDQWNLARADEPAK